MRNADCFRTHGLRMYRLNSGQNLQNKCVRRERSNNALPATSFHCYVRARPHDDRLDRNDAIVRHTCETDEPLTRMRRGTELIRLRARRPDVRATTRWSQVRVDRLVVTRPHDVRLPTKRERVREKGERSEKDSRRYERSGCPRHACIVARVSKRNNIS